ncbi:hypothetical protein GCM10010331_15300 [Streptomyces xanthochromogenes]|nr:hypothetical protein GCM10010331_15300 [Streptomyces xanthochromogenes]
MPDEVVERTEEDRLPGSGYGSGERGHVGPGAPPSLDGNRSERSARQEAFGGRGADAEVVGIVVDGAESKGGCGVFEEPDLAGVVVQAVAEERVGDAAFGEVEESLA